MGEAKRRRKLDPSYGKTPLINSKAQREKHLEFLLDGINSHFEADLKKIAHDELSDLEYQDIQSRISLWLKKKLESYRLQDRSSIATSIITFYLGLTAEYEVSPRLLSCIIDSLIPFLPEEQQTKLTEVMANMKSDLAKMKVDQ